MTVNAWIPETQVSLVLKVFMVALLTLSFLTITDVPFLRLCPWVH
jgi:hypothetical protein